jgi:hypothetical protein
MDRFDAMRAFIRIVERRSFTLAAQDNHRRLVSDPNVSDKEARSAGNCMVLHPACHDDPVEFYNLHGFYPDNLRRK